MKEKSFPTASEQSKNAPYFFILFQRIITNYDFSFHSFFSLKFQIISMNKKPTPYLAKSLNRNNKRTTWKLRGLIHGPVVLSPKEN